MHDVLCKLVALVGAIVLSASAAFAASLDGTVHSAGGDPVAGATVSLVELRLSTTTDADGRFFFTELQPGDYLLEVTTVTTGSAILRVAVREDGAAVAVELDQRVHSGSISVTATGRARGLDELAAPVDVLTDEELLLRREATLGETLAQQPGVAATGYGRGSSRPVIRGLGGDRIRVLENGLDSGDVSSIGPDHATAVEPLSAERIEVVRGPATLLYGGTAVGGVVNLFDGRIPDRVPTEPISGELLLQAGSNADELAGAVRADGGGGTFAWHVDAFWRDSDDYESPAPRLEGEEHHEDEHGEHDEDEEEHEAPETGTVPNSFVETEGANLGLSWVGEQGAVGISFGSYDSRYGVPGHHHHHEEEHEEPPLSLFKDEHDEHEEGVAVDLEKRRLDLHGYWEAPTTGIERVQLRAGWRDYQHQEMEGDELGTLFENQTVELRAEAFLAPMAGFEGVAGLHWSERDFAAAGAEAYVLPTTTERLAAFIFEELPAAPWGYQIGARLERQNTDSVDPELPSRNFNTSSFSAGITRQLGPDWLLSLSASHTERAPTAEELYSDGPHAATFAYEIGDPDLDSEKGNGIDLSLRSGGERVEGAASLFYTRFEDFIFLGETGEEIDELEVLQFSQADAEFMGMEFHGGVELLHRGAHHLHLEAIYDLVRAELRDDGEKLPRIPPQSARLGLIYLGERWSSRLEWRWVDSQTRVAEHESSTPSYWMLNLSAAYRLVRGSMVHELLFKGNNLTDEEAYNHVSFLKFQAPLPGRNLSLSYRLLF